MRKQVPVSQLRVGMAVAEVPGPWLSHGLWKTRFVIRDAADLAALQASDVAEVVIDTALGLDVAGPPALPRETGDQPAKPPAEPRPGSAAPQASPDGAPCPRRRSQPASKSWAEAQALVADAFKRMRAGESINQAAVSGTVGDIMSALESDRFAMMGLGLLKERDTYTFAHSVSVCALMVAFGQHLKLSTEHCHALGTAGLFHDIGKASLNEELILKRGPLTDDEFKQVKQHPALGANYLAQLRRTCPVALDVCLHHHERVDGSGYMSGLKGGEMTLESRMAAICDVYDAITSARPYKAAWDPAVALGRMVSWTGHFDRPLLASFVSMLSPYPVGTLVQLASGRVGVVVRPLPQTPRKAVVQVFYDARTHAHLSPRRIDLANGDDQIEAVVPEGAWSADVLAAVRRRAFSLAEV